MANPWNFRVLNKCIKQAVPNVDFQIVDTDATLGDLRREIANRLQIDGSWFRMLKPDDTDFGDDDVSLHAVIPQKGTASSAIMIKRVPELDDDEHDGKFKHTANVSARRRVETAPVYGPQPMGPMGYHTYLPAAQKSHTGYTGLSNQGATCYMNSLIQSLFMTPEFRTAVYNWSFTDAISKRVEKLLESGIPAPNAGNGSSAQDLSWLESATELLALWTRLELETTLEKQETHLASANQPEPPLREESGSSSSSPSSSAAETTTKKPIDSEENYESKFVKAARAQDERLHAHAIAFETWKKSIESRSIPFQLRLLFAKLQLSEQRAVSTKGLTKSFGWTATEAFTQHDVQELLRVLFDALEQAWAGTPQHSLINDLYQGSVLDYVRCSFCGYKSSRRDTFLDLQLTVNQAFGSGAAIKSVEEALEKYVQPEVLDGENQYHCSECDRKRDATKGLEFATLPYLLSLHLKRFDFDWATDRRIKLNDRVTFPEILNLNHLLPGGATRPVGAAHPTLIQTLDSFTIPSGCTIRVATRADLPAIIEVVNLAFPQSHVESQIVTSLTNALPRSQLISLVATNSEDKIIGHIMFSPVSLAREGQELSIKESSEPTQLGTKLSSAHLDLVPKLFGLAPLSVHPAKQRLGIGSALVKIGLEMCMIRGIKAVVALGHNTFYTKLGFAPASKFAISYNETAGDAFMAVEISDGVFHRQNVGGGCVRYHPLFEEACKDASGSEMQPNGATKGEAAYSTYSALENDIAFDDMPEQSSLTRALRDGPAVYNLFAIFVHRGSAQGGHYYAYIKDFNTDKWFEFNDSTVAEISKYQVESTFGDSSPYATGGTAYMLLYRQHDPSRNMPYPATSSIPLEAIEAVELEKKRKVTKEALKRLEAQKIGIMITYRGSRKEIRLHRDQTVQDAIKVALSAFQVAVPLEDARFHTTSLFARADDASLFDLANPLSMFTRDTISQVQLQIRERGKEFKPYDPRSVLFLMNVFDMQTQSWPAEAYEVYLPQRPTMGHLRAYIRDEFGIPIADQLITKEKNSAAPVELVAGEDDRTLSFFSLWEKANLWVESFTPDLIDQSYKPNRRKRLVSPTLSSSKYSSPNTANLHNLSNGTTAPAASASTVIIPSGNKSNNSLSDSGEMHIVALGDSDDGSVTNSTDAEIVSTDTSTTTVEDAGTKNGNDDGYEYFHDPKYIIRDGQRIIPRSEDLIKNIQNRLIVRFTALDGAEVKHTLVVSKKDSVASLRQTIAEILNVDPFTFVILKYLSTGELNDANASIESFVYGSYITLQVKKGTPSLKGESMVKFEPFVLPARTGAAPETRPFEPFEAFLCTDRLTIKDAKLHVRTLAKLDPNLPLELIRLRKYGYDGHAGPIGLDGQKLSHLGSKILVQIVKGAINDQEVKKSDQHKVVILRQVFPESWEMSDAMEFCVPPGGTYGDVAAHCEAISGLPAVDCSIRPIYNVPQLADMDRMDWKSFTTRLERTVSIMTSDGDYIFFCDPRIPFKAISEEEKRRLAKYKPPRSTYTSLAERALTIKVDHH